MLSHALWLLCLMPLGAAAQTPPQPPDARQAESSNLWIVGGTTFATVRGDCQTCEGEYPYRHSATILANLGYRVNPRMDIGAEIYWVPLDSASGQIRTIHIDAIAQFRPWASKGFFLKGGAGMAFVRNWVDAVGESPITSKALSVVVGAGWEFRPTERVGFQLFGTQHAAALGDLLTAEATVDDVMGNYWSLGAAVVIR
jgi:hypothetical protein